MKVYALNEAHTYNPESRQHWKQLTCPWEEAIQAFAGETTLMLLWEEPETESLHSLVIPSKKDVYNQAKAITDVVVNLIKERIIIR